MKAIAITYTPHLTRVSAALAGVIAISVILYGVFLLAAVANTAERAKAERHTRELTSRVGTLEAEYLSHTQTLTLAKAHEMGFVTPEVVTTVYATAANRSLSQNK